MTIDSTFFFWGGGEHKQREQYVSCPINIIFIRKARQFILERLRRFAELGQTVTPVQNPEAARRQGKDNLC